jgi:hypothetical protein
MKKLYFILLAVFIFGCCNKNKETPEFFEDSQAKYIYDKYLLKSSENLNYEFTFDPLADNELLKYSFSYGLDEEKYKFNNKEYKFRLSAVNLETNEERVIGYWNVSWGNFQISINRKSGLFFLDDHDYNYNGNFPLFLIDGTKGTVHYLMDTNLSAMSNYDLSYLLVSYDTSDGLFLLIDLKEINIIRLLSWRKNEQVYGTGYYRIYRNIHYNRYDYRIDFFIESGALYSVAYYNIKENRLDTILDLSDFYESKEKPKPRGKITKEELGR